RGNLTRKVVPFQLKLDEPFGYTGGLPENRGWNDRHLSVLDFVVPEEGLEPSQGYPYRILSLMTSETTTQMSLKEPTISSFDYANVRQASGVFCCRTRTKGGRKTALNPLVAQCSLDVQSGAPVYCRCSKPYF